MWCINKSGLEQKKFLYASNGFSECLTRHTQKLERLIITFRTRCRTLWNCISHIVKQMWNCRTNGLDWDSWTEFQMLRLCLFRCFPKSPLIWSTHIIQTYNLCHTQLSGGSIHLLMDILSLVLCWHCWNMNFCFINGFWELSFQQPLHLALGSFCFSLSFTHNCIKGLSFMLWLCKKDIKYGSTLQILYYMELWFLLVGHFIHAMKIQSIPLHRAHLPCVQPARVPFSALTVQETLPKTHLNNVLQTCQRKTACNGHKNQKQKQGWMYTDKSRARKRRQNNFGNNLKIHVNLKRIN